MSSFFSSVSVKVLVEQDIIFLHPSPHPSIPSEDPILRGFVVISLPSPKAAYAIKVNLEGKSSYTGGDGWPHEEVFVLKKELEIELGGEVLPAGEHRYEFSFIIPSSAADYQRCRYGQTRYFVSASLKGSGSFGSSSFSSSPLSIALVCNSAPPGTVPDFLNVLLSGYRPELGPININVSSPHLTVSSLVLFDISLLSPPASLRHNILSVVGILEQTFTILYKNGKVAQPPMQRHTLFRVDQSTPPPKPASACALDVPLPGNALLMTLKPLEEVSEGVPWSYRYLTRLPNDDKIRPSTLQDTETRIRVAHNVGVEITYRREDGVTETVKLSRKIHITSCCCLRDSLRLPAYSRNPAHVTKVAVPGLRCTCDESFEDLVEAEEKEAFGLEEQCSEQWVSTVDRLTKSPAVVRS